MATPNKLTQKDGSQPHDANQQTIPMASYVVYQDGTTPTPQDSPLTVDADIEELVIPTNAAICTITAQGADLDVGRDDDLSDGFTLVPAGVTRSFEVVDKATLYLRKNASTAVTAYFDFSIF